MWHKGWYDRPGVRILEGRWQDIFSSDEMVDIGKFDIVYFDTFQEGYSGHVAFIKNVPGLLRGPGSRFSYFNGHGTGGETMYQVGRTVRVVPLRSLPFLQLYPSLSIPLNVKLVGVYGGCAIAPQ